MAEATMTRKGIHGARFRQARPPQEKRYRMSAYHVYENAPLGSLIRFSDGTPRPSDENSREFEAWRKRNGSGLLARRTPSPELRSWTPPASITLRHLDPDRPAPAGSELLLTFSVDSDLRFEIIERPAFGTSRVRRGEHDEFELLDMASSLADTERYLSLYPSGGLLIEQATADERAADAVEGRSRSVRAAVARRISRADRPRAD